MRIKKKIVTGRDKTLELAENKIGDDEIDFAIRIALQQIPYIGGSLSEILSYRRQKIEKKRLHQCLEKLREEIKLIDENKIDKNFPNTEEFSDVLRRTLENSIRTRNIEKMRLFCKILAGTLNKDNIEDRHYAEDFLYFVEDLTLADIIVGLEIYKSQINKPDHFDAESQDKNELKFVTESGWDKLEEHSPVKGLDRRIALHKLSAAGLIKEVVGVYLSYTGGKYIMTPMFQKLINFIHLRANDPLFSSMIPDSRD